MQIDNEMNSSANMEAAAVSTERLRWRPWVIGGLVGFLIGGFVGHLLCWVALASNTSDSSRNASKWMLLATDTAVWHGKIIRVNEPYRVTMHDDQLYVMRRRMFRETLDLEPILRVFNGPARDSSEIERIYQKCKQEATCYLPTMPNWPSGEQWTCYEKHYTFYDIPWTYGYCAWRNWNNSHARALYSYSYDRDSTMIYHVLRSMKPWTTASPSVP